jgi:16S rRNA (guanine527-N7)-methyltransferase
MDEKEYIELLKKAFNDNKLGDVITEEKASKLHLFSDILIKTNKQFNLTAITDEKDIILKHFVDCATVIKHIPPESSIIDIGCGAGFPSLPIAILREDVKITALDSTAKKINFINSTAKDLQLSNISAICSRAEDFAAKNRERFDISISRAVARLNILDELCIPLTKTGGRFIAMKSSKGEEEYFEAEKGILKLGAKLESKEIINLKLESLDIEREIFIFKKNTPTPPQYPRNYSQISKKPL